MLLNITKIVTCPYKATASQIKLHNQIVFLCTSSMHQSSHNANNVHDQNPIKFWKLNHPTKWQIYKCLFCTNIYNNQIFLYLEKNVQTLYNVVHINPRNHDFIHSNQWKYLNTSSFSFAHRKSKVFRHQQQICDQFSFCFLTMLKGRLFSVSEPI